MNYVFVLLILMTSISCQKEEKKATHSVSTHNAKDPLAKKDESCDTEEDIKKKLEEEIKKAQEGKASLKGLDTGCSTD